MILPATPHAYSAPISASELRTLAGRLIEHSAAPTALVDPSGHIVDANSALLALWRLPDRELARGLDLTDGLRLEPERTASALAAVATQGLWQGELSAIAADGATLRLQATLQALNDETTTPADLLATFVDNASEQARQIESDELRRFSERIVDDAGALIVVLDEDGRILRFNRECERLSGLRVDEVLGRSPWETFLPPEAARTVRTQAFDGAMAAAQPGQVCKYTNEWICRGGERRLIAWSNRVLLDRETGRRVVVCVGVDVSGQRPAEQALVRSEAQLRAAQAVAQMGSWELDFATGVLVASDELRRLFGTDRPSSVAACAELLATIHADDRALVADAYRRLLETREPYRLKHRLRLADGRIKWVEAYGEADFDAAGKPLRSRGTVQDVTERHARDVDMARLRHLVEQAPMEIWLIDDSFRVAYVNRAAASSLGTTPQGLIGTELSDIDVGGVAAVSEIAAAIANHLHTESPPQAFRVSHRAADGSAIPKEMYATVREIDGRAYGISFARDIREELRTERALADREALLQSALEAYPGWVACVDRDMRYVYVNGRFRHEAGKSSAEIIGRTADEVFGPEAGRYRRLAHRRLLAGRSSTSMEQRFVDGNGQERITWVEYRRAERTQASQRELFFAFATEVTALRRTQQRLTAVTQDMGIGLWEWVHPGGVLDFNDELLALVGCSHSDVQGDALAWLRARIHPEDRATRRQIVCKLLSGQVRRAHVQLRVRHKQGHAVWVQEALRAFHRNGAAAPVRLIGVVQDISALKARETELEALALELEARVERRTLALKEARREAERANAAKSEFLSHMSHELRTPLNAVIGFAQLLEMAALPPEEAQHVREVMTAGRHLLQLIDDILDLSRVEAGHARVQQAALALPPLLADCVRLLQPLAQTAGVVLDLEPVPATALVKGDAVRLRQVLMNLLSNAVKYNRSGGQVRVSARTCAAGWEIQVSDSGAGLTSEQIERIFVPFERLDAPRAGIQGTGIGLSLSRRLAELMGGTLEVQSVPGQGSTFALCLPRPQTPATEAEPPARAGPAPAQAAQGAPRRRVLYVEDNMANLRLMSRLLAQREEVELRTAATAREALAIAPLYRPDLLLVDIRLPDGDGHELLAALRAQGIDSPAVAVSANALSTEVARGLAAGFAAYLTKPLELSRTLQVIDHALRSAPAAH